MVASGQSNARGAGASGSKTVQGGIKIWNGSAMIAAAFGTSPLNFDPATSGTTAVAADAANNIAVHMANNIRLSGLIPSTREIWIIPNWFAGQSIGNWVGSGVLSANWAALTSALSGAGVSRIDHFYWVQGEADFTATSYSTQDTYGAAFLTLFSQITALPQWNAACSTITVQELNQFPFSNGSTRNDYLRTLAVSPPTHLLSLVSSAGMESETPTASNPHWDGASLVTLGFRHFQAWAAQALGIGAPMTVRDSTGYARVHGNYILGVDNAATFADGRTRSGTPICLGEDDLRTGLTLRSSNCTWRLPGLGEAGGNTALNYNVSVINVNKVSDGDTILTGPQGITTDDDSGTTVSLTRTGTYLLLVRDQRWWVKQLFPRFLVTSLDSSTIVNTGNAVVGNAATFAAGGTTNTLSVISPQVIAKASNDTTAPALNFYKSRNADVTAHTTVVAADNIGDISFFADDGTNTNSRVARITAVATGAISSGVVPGIFRIFTTDAAGASTQAITIDSSQMLTALHGLTVSGTNLTLSDGINIGIGATNGTKIGLLTTSKLGFFAATPVIQPVGTSDVLASLVSLGLRAASINPPLNLGTGALTAGISALGATSTTSITATGAMNVTGNMSIADAINIAADTTTGTKIGTGTGQKLGFWNKAPAAQQVFPTGAAATVDDVITFLQSLGLCRQS